MKTSFMNTQQSNSSKFNLKKVCWLVSTVFLAASFNLHAADIEKEFRLTTEVTRLSNPNFVLDDKSPVTVFKIAPEFNISASSELNKFYLNSMLSVFRNSNEDVLPDRENPTIIAGWERTLASGLFGLEAFYQEDIAINQQLTTTGNATAGNNVENESKTKSITAKWDHDFNATTSIKNKLSYADYSFSADTFNLVDYNLTDFGSRLIFRNSETLATYGLFGYQSIDPDGIETSSIARLRAGVLLNPIEGLEVDANGGFYKTSGVDSMGGTEAEVLGTYTRDRFIYNFGVNRVLAAGGIGQFQKSSSIVLGAKYLITELRAVGAEYSNSFNRAPSNPILGSVTQDIRFQFVSAYYEHGFKDWTARASAKFISLDNGTTRHGNEIGVALIYSPSGL